MKIHSLFSLSVMALALATRAADDTTANVSRNLPDYQPLKTPVAGSITCVGSNTVANLLNRWAVDFKRAYPNIDITITAGGSSGAAPALTAGQATLAPMSRPMTDEEIAAFAKKWGYAPTKISVAVDALAIFVEKNNPIPHLTLEQIDSVFSRTFNRGGKSVRNWSELGAIGDLANTPIARYGPAKDSGTADVLKLIALDKGELSLQFTLVYGSSSVVQGIGADPAGIGFASVVMDTKRTRHVPIRLDDGTVVAPTYQNVTSGKYPLHRFLYIYVNKDPNKPLDTATLEFLKFALSEDGQRVVARDGTMPLTAALAAEQRKVIGAE